MITRIEKDEALVSAFHLQRRSYEVEAKRIDFHELPPLKESLEQFQQAHDIKIGFYQEGILCGFLAYERRQDRVEIQKVVVDPAYFHQGIARKLLRNLEERNENITTFMVHAAKKNVAARTLYEHCGYMETSDQVYPGIVMIEYRKQIDRNPKENNDI